MKKYSFLVIILSLAIVRVAIADDVQNNQNNNDPNYQQNQVNQNDPNQPQPEVTYAPPPEQPAPPVYVPDPNQNPNSN
jgi:hypothetical protein